MDFVPAATVLPWYQVILIFIVMPLVCAFAGYMHGHEKGYEEGYNNALADIKGNNEDFDHIIGGG